MRRKRNREALSRIRSFLKEREEEKIYIVEALRGLKPQNNREYLLIKSQIGIYNKRISRRNEENYLAMMAMIAAKSVDY